MSQFSLPQQGILVGDASRAPYDADEWSIDYTASLLGFARRANYGVILGYDNGSNFSLEVTQTTVASNQVELKIGAALVRGTLYINDATLTLTVQPNASGNPRIDTIILRKDYIAQTIVAAVLQGSPAASPVPPTLTQSATLWEIPIVDIAVANGFTALEDTAITGRQEFVNVGNGVFEDHVLNNSGSTLEDGDVVIWDSSSARAVTTTTTANHWKVAGVWRGRTANGARGRIQTKGFGRVKFTFDNDAVPLGLANIGTPIVTGYYAKTATQITIRKTPSVLRGTDGGLTLTYARTGSAPAQLGVLMQLATEVTGVGVPRLVLAYIDVQKRANPHTTLLKRKGTADNGGFTSGSWVTRIFTHAAHGAELDTSMAGGGNTINVNNYVTVNVSTGAITIQPGIYMIRGWSAGYRCDGHLTRLQDTTNAATVVVSRPAYSPSAADSSQSYAELATFLIVESATVYELQARCTTTRATDGSGKYVGFSSESVTFVQLEIVRYNEVYT